MNRLTIFTPADENNGSFRSVELTDLMWIAHSDGSISFHVNNAAEARSIANAFANADMTISARAHSQKKEKAA